LAQAKGQSLPSDMQALIDAGPEAWERAKKLIEGGGPWPAGTAFPVKEVNLQRDLPKEPVYFTKPPTSVIGPDAPIEYPDESISSKMDWEAELALVMG